MKKTILFSALCFAPISFANNDIYQQCLNDVGSSNDKVMALCSEEASNSYKKQITASYNRIYEHYNNQEPEKAKAFENAQKAWLNSRNKNCAISESKEQCLMQFNKQRSEELMLQESKLTSLASPAYEDSPPKITYKKVSLFNEKTKGKDPSEGSGSMTFSYETLETNLPWLNNLLNRELDPNSNDIKSLKKNIAKEFEEYKESDYISGEEYINHSIEFEKQKGNYAIFKHYYQLYVGGNADVENSSKIYINLKTKDLMKAKDFFADDSLDEIKELLWNEFKKSEAGMDADNESKDDFPISENFEFIADGMLFKYGQGTIALSVHGPQEYIIPSKKIKSLLKPEIKELLGNKN